MHCYKCVFSGVRWREVVNVVGLFAPLCHD